MTGDQGLGNGEWLARRRRGHVGQHILLRDASARAGADDLGEIDVQLSCQAGYGGGDEAEIGGW